MPEFASPAEHYDRFMGRYTIPLARAFADEVGVGRGMRVLDVGCGPGGLTSELADRVGAESVAAIDPAEQFVAACRERNPGADVRQGVAEELPWEDDTFDAALSSLVIAFMRDADAGLREMKRVTRPGGTVTCAVWDYSEGMQMLCRFWEDAVALDPAAVPRDERRMPLCRRGELTSLFRRHDFAEIDEAALTIQMRFSSFDDYWSPFLENQGPAGVYVSQLDEAARERLRLRLRRRALADGADRPFELSARAWAVRGRLWAAN